MDMEGKTNECELEAFSTPLIDKEKNESSPCSSSEEKQEANGVSERTERERSLAEELRSRRADASGVLEQVHTPTPSQSRKTSFPENNF